jgi:hypothetical protein
MYARNASVVAVPWREDAHRSLTKADLALCLVPIALFLSIVSFV